MKKLRSEIPTQIPKSFSGIAPVLRPLTILGPALKWGRKTLRSIRMRTEENAKRMKRKRKMTCAEEAAFFSFQAKRVSTGRTPQAAADKIAGAQALERIVDKKSELASFITDSVKNIRVHCAFAAS
jgi:hypothetical protein